MCRGLSVSPENSIFYIIQRENMAGNNIGSCPEKFQPCEKIRRDSTTNLAVDDKRVVNIDKERLTEISIETSINPHT